MAAPNRATCSGDLRMSPAIEGGTTENEFHEADAVLIAKALGDPIRLRTYSEIAQHQEICAGELRVCEIVTPATVSHHLQTLSRAGLVSSHRKGQHILYRAIPGRLAAYRRYLTRLDKRTANRA